MKNKGFTLIELLVVIAIISLLSSIVYASVSEVRTKAAFTKTNTQGVEIKKGIMIADYVLSGANVAPEYVNTDPDVPLSEKPDIATTIFPDLAGLSIVEGSGENGMGTELGDALPKVSYGTDTVDGEYYYFSDGEKACYDATNEAPWLTDCLPIRCVNNHDHGFESIEEGFLADDYIVAYKLECPEPGAGCPNIPSYVKRVEVTLDIWSGWGHLSSWSIYPGYIWACI